MDDAKDPDSSSRCPVSENVWRNDRLMRTRDAARSAHLGMALQRIDCRHDPVDGGCRGLLVIFGDVGV
jgi:hypothetical protein